MFRPGRASLMSERRDGKALLAAMLVVGTGLVVSAAGLAFPGIAHAQDAQVSNIFAEAPPLPEDQLLLESDELIYDNDRNLVIAIGNVQIAYGRSTLVADQVEYNQQSGRVLAIGNVEILEPNGNRIFAQEIDITDDFRDGFVSALNVRTPDNSRIAAESAERQDGDITRFRNGVYTACAQCKKNPEKPPFWQIRAKTVVIDDTTKSVEYEDATFEFFGRPVVRLSRFSHADPAVKRRSGFLIPSISDDENLGFGYGQGYFFNLAPNYDLTVWGTYYAHQGFLGEAEWRHRTENGEYSIRFAGIDQADPSTFTANTVDATENERYAVITNGRFALNRRWQFGWRGLLQSDDNFARTYNIAGLDARDVTNEVYLRGIGEKNYFNLSAQDFLVQDNRFDTNGSLAGNQTFTEQQATVIPVLDYNAVSGEEFGYGQFSFDMNVTSLSRSAPQADNLFVNATTADDRFHGVEGTFSRASAELEWKGASITGGGAVVTTSLSLRTDAMFQDNERPGSLFNPLTSNDSIYRAMPAGMMEIRYPLVANSGTATHLFEPIAQVVARPDETHIGDFVNEDAQSMVFDTANLFERDKFSGYDRVEGGTRANVGFRYSTSFVSGASMDIVAGQSFHLAGHNSYADTRDLVNAGTESGLETDRSDYVASLQVDNGAGLGAGVGVRLDEADLGLKRAEVSTRVIQPRFSFTSSYIFTEAQPNSRSILSPINTVPRDRHEIGGSASVRLDDNWRLFGGMTFDIETSGLVRDNMGLAYDNDCFSFAVSYSNLSESFNGVSSGQSIQFSLGLRTIGGFQRTVSADIFTEEN